MYYMNTSETDKAIAVWSCHHIWRKPNNNPLLPLKSLSTNTFDFKVIDLTWLKDEFLCIPKISGVKCEAICQTAKPWPKKGSSTRKWLQAQRSIYNWMARKRNNLCQSIHPCSAAVSFLLLTSVMLITWAESLRLFSLNNTVFTLLP